MEKYLAVAITVLSGIGGAIWWLIKKINTHDSDLNELKKDVDNMHEIMIPEKLADHESRLRTVERENEKILDKLDNLMQTVSEVKGLLTAKKDKE